MMLPIRKILCPTDFSEPSYTGMERANELARHFSAELIMVHVVSAAHFYSYPGSGFNIAAYLDEMIDASKKSLEELKERRISTDVNSRAIVLQGLPADQIIDLALSERVDMIVTATHGWTGWRRFVFGSVAEKVVRNAPCPVLTIPAPEETEKR
ncbi:MAG: universal stress protein [Syntrophales bacterium]|jgi:nucleotide-binding universal stress UspA family protein|nr:universal stress protein [Syntrophales bacterium]MDY0045611.1 universal stress protein [Syntrophales bacterium]